MRLVTALAAFLAFISTAASSLADQPRDWQIWHQEPATDIMARIVWFDKYTFYFIVPITIFVLFLLLYVMVRFRKGANPVPSRNSHNTLIEVIWTVAPIIILVMIAVPSFDLLNRQLLPDEEPKLTIKATGYQWYWGYEYQDESGISFDSIMMQENERDATGKTDKAVYPRLLAVDNEVVVPVNAMVRVLVTAADVLHSFTIPAFGFKMDAVPGRINETWFKAEREGLYYGQCSELCGRDHAFMPIAFRVVNEAQYQAWKARAASDLEGANKDLMAQVDAARSIKLAGN
ncbi:MAG: cytochrome c oxidase subunit II [Rhizobiaceae bacterium]